MLFKNREMNKLLKDYPCADYLHNALKFIADEKPEAAYDEICCAILRSGGSLTEEESRIRDPKGNDIVINKFYKETADGMVEISEEEYLERRKVIEEDNKA